MLSSHLFTFRTQTVRIMVAPYPVTVRAFTMRGVVTTLSPTNRANTIVEMVTTELHDELALILVNCKPPFNVSFF
jgi:hypothetical protein